MKANTPGPSTPPAGANTKQHTAALILCVAFLIGQGLYSAKINSVTADEYIHLPIAISILQTRDIVMDHSGSPPLRAILALPALATSPVMDYTSRFWRIHKSYQFSWEFLKNNFARYSQIFFISRLSVIAVSIILCLFIYALALQLFGRNAATIAAFLFCLNPETMAHSSLFTVDMLAACFFLSSFTALSNFSKKPIPST